MSGSQLVGRSCNGGLLTPLGRAQVMLTIGRGEHGSTYGGNPIAARVAMAALQVILDIAACRAVAVRDTLYIAASICPCQLLSSYVS